MAPPSCARGPTAVASHVLARRYSHRVPGPIDIPTDQFVILDGVRFHYLDWGGDGETVLLLAGLGCTAHVFAEFAPQLSDRFRVLALTRRGHGLTDQVQSGYALVDAAEDARRLLDALGIERAHLVGHSMGGGEVSALAARHPGRVGRIVYLDGAYDWADSPTPEWPEEAASPDTFASYGDYVDVVYSCSPRTSGDLPSTRCCAPPWTPSRTGQWWTSTPSRL